MGAYGIVMLIIAMILYWGFHWSILWSAIVAAIVGPILVGIFQATFGGLGRKNKANDAAPAGENNPTDSPPPVQQ